MTLIIEEINRAKRVLQRYRFEQGTTVKIGRALTNDVVLNEPHVSPHHVEISINDDGQMVLHDLNSLNGVRSAKRKKIADGSVIRSGDTLLLGRSYVRVLDQAHPVEATWPLHSIEDFFHAMSSVWVVAGLLLLFILGEWQSFKLQHYQDIATSRLINELLYEFFIIFGWASAWSLSGRVTRHDSRFLSHLSVSILAAMLFQWVPIGLRVLAYNGLYGDWLSQIRYFINGGILSLLLWCNFYLTLPQRSSVRIILSNAIAWSLVLVYLLPPIFDSRSFKGYPDYDRLVMSPSVLWAAPQTPEQFAESAELLYPQAKIELDPNKGKTAENELPKEALNEDQKGKDGE